MRSIFVFYMVSIFSICAYAQNNCATYVFKVQAAEEPNGDEQDYIGKIMWCPTEFKVSSSLHQIEENNAKLVGVTQSASLKCTGEDDYDSPYIPYMEIKLTNKSKLIIRMKDKRKTTYLEIEPTDDQTSYQKPILKENLFCLYEGAPRKNLQKFSTFDEYDWLDGMDVNSCENVYDSIICTPDPFVEVIKDRTLCDESIYKIKPSKKKH